MSVQRAIVVWSIAIAGAFFLLFGIAYNGAVNASMPTATPDDAWAIVTPAEYMAPTPTATPNTYAPLPPAFMPNETVPDACMTLACANYGATTSSASKSKSKVSYPYLLTTSRTSKNGAPYTYTRWVMTAPVKSTKTTP